MTEDSIESIAYAEALRAIEAQSTTLESLRTRASTVLSAASVVTAFLGGLALAPATISGGEIERQALTGWSWVAIASFGGVVLLSLLILFPYRYRSQVDATKLMREAIRARATTNEVHRDLARYFSGNREANQRLLWRLVVFFDASAVLLLLEAVAWVVNLT